MLCTGTRLPLLTHRRPVRPVETALEDGEIIQGHGGVFVGVNVCAAARRWRTIRPIETCLELREMAKIHVTVVVEVDARHLDDDNSDAVQVAGSADTS